MAAPSSARDVRQLINMPREGYAKPTRVLVACLADRCGQATLEARRVGMDKLEVLFPQSRPGANGPRTRVRTRVKMATRSSHSEKSHTGQATGD